MTRFYSFGEIKKQEEKLKNINSVNDINNLKDKLKDDINKEYHRINVDSAKKKAVNQRMDYDGFHQMVLGADLKGLRQEEIAYIDYKNNEKVLNSNKIKENLTKEIDVLENVFTENLNKNDEKENINLNFIHDKKDLKVICNNYRKEINNCQEENEDQLIMIFHEIESKLKFFNFLNNLDSTSLEPRFYSKLLKIFSDLLIMVNKTLNFMKNLNIEKKEKNSNEELKGQIKFMSSLLDVIKDFVLGVNEYGKKNNLQKYKIFIGKKIKESILDSAKNIILNKEFIYEDINISSNEKEYIKEYLDFSIFEDNLVLITNIIN